jgi:hypothetical protein
MPEKKSSDPLTVVVKNGRWDAYGPLTIRSQHLITVLNMIGGVSDRVPDGKYRFDVLIHGMTIISSLTPIED